MHMLQAPNILINYIVTEEFKMPSFLTTLQQVFQHWSTKQPSHIKSNSSLNCLEVMF